MKFYLTRHCETDWTRVGRLQGFTDTNLNGKGWMQAEELALKLRALDIKKIISSDLKRSMETASVLEKYIKVPVLSDARLRECSFGTLEGKMKDEVMKIYKPRTVNIDGLWHGSFFVFFFTEFGGESRDQVLRRQLSLLDRLYIDDEPAPILLVGHGTSLNTLVTHLKRPQVDRGEYVEIEYPVQVV